MKLKIELDTENLKDINVKVNGKRLENVERMIVHFDPLMLMGHIRQAIAPEQSQTTSFRAAGGETEVNVK